MNNQLSLHLRFSTSRNNLIIAIILITGYLLSILYSCNVETGYFYNDMDRETNYFNLIIEVAIITRFIIVVLGIFIGILFNSDSNNNLIKYTINHKSDKITFWIWRIVFQILALAIFLVIMFFIFIIAIIIFTSFDYDIWNIIEGFTKVYVMGLFYLLLVNLLMVLSNSILIGIGPIIMFWFMEINLENFSDQGKGIIQTLYTYVPTLGLKDGLIIYNSSFLGYFLVMISIYCICIITYFLKDIK